MSPSAPTYIYYVWLLPIIKALDVTAGVFPSHHSVTCKQGIPLVLSMFLFCRLRLPCRFANYGSQAEGRQVTSPLSVGRNNVGLPSVS